MVIQLSPHWNPAFCAGQVADPGARMFAVHHDLLTNRGQREVVEQVDENFGSLKDFRIALYAFPSKRLRWERSFDRGSRRVKNGGWGGLGRYGFRRQQETPRGEPDDRAFEVGHVQFPVQFSFPVKAFCSGNCKSR